MPRREAESALGLVRKLSDTDHFGCLGSALLFFLATYRIAPMRFSSSAALSLLIGPPLALMAATFVYRREEA
jgi:hypothetical protein